MGFQKAVRKKVKLRMAIDGPSGSGKTWSALEIATGIVSKTGGKIAVIDAEDGAAAAYSDRFDFDISEIKAPYSPEKYIRELAEAAEAGYSVVILDSISHAWSGQGGLLDQKDTVAKGMRGNSFAAWREISPKHNRFVESMLSYPGHLIATMRTKTHWDFETDEKTGKKKPVKIGLKPEQKEGIEYEFTLVLDMSLDGHIASVSKDRTGVLDGRYFQPNKDTGIELVEWLEEGKTMPVLLPNETVKATTKEAWISWQEARGDVEEWKKVLAKIGITPGMATAEQIQQLNKAVRSLQSKQHAQKVAEEIAEKERVDSIKDKMYEQSLEEAKEREAIQGEGNGTSEG